MTSEIFDKLSRLERRIMDAIYRRGEAPVSDVVADLGENESYHSVRVTMGNLAKKGVLTARRDGARNVYRPTVPERRARASAMEHLLETFFDGSPSDAILGLIDMSASSLSDDEIAEIRARIEQAERDA